MDYGYNVLGERTSQTDALGAQTNFIYDALGRLITIDYPQGTGEANIDAHFGYGPKDLRKTMTDGGGATTWTHNALGQVETVKTVKDQSQKVVEYGYDGLGNRTKLVYPDLKTATYGYDKLNRLKTVTGWSTQVTNYTYPSTQTGFTRQVQRPNGVVSIDTINEVGRLVERVHTRGDTILASYHYKYEPDGNRWQATESMWGDPLFLPVILKSDDGGEQGMLSGSPEAGETIDGTGDIETGEAYPAPFEAEPLPMEDAMPEEGGYPGPEATTHSPSLLDLFVGFFTWLLAPQDTVQAADAFQAYPPPPGGGGAPGGGTLPGFQSLVGPIENTYLYDPLHRLTNATDNFGNTYAYAYDANGNRVSEQVPGGSPVTSAYDKANRLTSVGGVTFTWDANGNLTNDGTHKYIYDQANRLKTVTDQVDVPLATYTYNGLGDRLTENNTQFVLDLNAGLTQVLQDGTYTYLYGSERIMQESQTSTGYFLGDALGSVRQLVDENGAVALTRTYEPYGELASSSGLSATTVYGYTGEYSSQDLIYLRARYYTPDDGRFLTRDTWQGDYTLPMSYNAWLYGYSSPVNFSDPSGLCASSDVECHKVASKIKKDYSVNIDLGVSMPFDHTLWQKIVDAGLTPCSLGITTNNNTWSGLSAHWTVEELRKIDKTLKFVKYFLDHSKTSFNTTLGNKRLSIKKVMINSKNQTFPNTIGTVVREPFANVYYSTIELPVETVKDDFEGMATSFIHELMHAYDYSFAFGTWDLFSSEKESVQNGGVWNSNLDPTFSAKCGPTKYACDNAQDNFAESATIYMLYWMQTKSNSTEYESMAKSIRLNYTDVSGVDEVDKYDVLDPNQWSDGGKRLQRLKDLFGHK